MRRTFSPVIWSSLRGCSCDSRYCDNSDLRMDTAYTGADRGYEVLRLWWQYGDAVRYIERRDMTARRQVLCNF